MRAAALQAGEEQTARARAGISAEDDSVLKDIEASGVSVVRLSEAEREAFRKATAGVYQEWSGRVGAELVKQAEEDIAAR